MKTYGYRAHVPDRDILILELEAISQGKVHPSVATNIVVVRADNSVSESSIDAIVLAIPGATKIPNP